MNYIAHLTGRSYIVVGHGGLTLNLIRGTTPELAASYLKSCFIASGSAGGSGAFFVDQAVELCRNSLTLLMLKVATTRWPVFMKWCFPLRSVKRHSLKCSRVASSTTSASSDLLSRSGTTLRTCMAPSTRRC